MESQKESTELARLLVELQFIVVGIRKGSCQVSLLEKRVSTKRCRTSGR